MAQTPEARQATLIKHREKHRDYYRNWHFQRKFGISLEQRNEMLVLQNNVCAICLQPERVKNRSLCVDHCHKTGKIRKLLCQSCNTALGKLEEDPERLKRMIAYIEEHKDDLTEEDSHDS